MNYKDALHKLKSFQFGIVVEDGTDSSGDMIHYVLRFKGDSELETVSENVVNGKIVAVKSGSEVYVSGGGE